MGKTVAQKFFKRVAKKMKKLGETHTKGTHRGTECHRYSDRWLLQEVGQKAAKKMHIKSGGAINYWVDADGDVHVGDTLLVCGSTLYQI